MELKLNNLLNYNLRLTPPLFNFIISYPKVNCCNLVAICPCFSLCCWNPKVHIPYNRGCALKAITKFWWNLSLSSFTVVIDQANMKFVFALFSPNFWVALSTTFMESTICLTSSSSLSFCFCYLIFFVASLFNVF